MIISYDKKKKKKKKVASVLFITIALLTEE